MNWEKEFKKFEDIGTLQGEVIEIKEGVGADFFGEKAIDPERPTLAVRIKIDETGEEFTEYMSIPRGFRGYAQSKAKRWTQRYGLPAKGQKVQVEIDGRGFFRVVL